MRSFIDEGSDTSRILTPSATEPTGHKYATSFAMCRNAADAKAEPLLYTTAAHDRSSKGSSSLQASAALCKGIIGTGIFALPTAIRATGWALGSLCVLGLAFASTFGMGAVIYSIQELRTRSAATWPPAAR